MVLTACRAGSVSARRKAERNNVGWWPSATMMMMMDHGGRSVHVHSCRERGCLCRSPFLLSSLVDLLLLSLLLLACSVPQSVDAVNLYDRLYARGGRSFSVIDPENMTVVWDSGDAFERNVSALSGSYFNSRGFTAEEYNSLLEHRILNQTAGPQIRSDWLAAFRDGTADSQSTSLGCRPRALVLGMMNGGKDRYLFIALTNPAGIMVYNFSNPVAPTFKSWTKLSAQHLEPEALHFTEADQTDAPYLYVTCGFSASLLVFQVNADGGLTVAAPPYDGTTMGALPVPFGSRLINGLPTYSAMSFVPEDDNIYNVPMILVANQFARRVEVFLFNTSAPTLAFQHMGEIDLSTGIPTMNASVQVFKPGFPTDVYVQANVLAITVVPYNPALISLSVEEQAALSPGSVLFYQLNVDGNFPFTFLNATETGSYPKKTVCAGAQCLVANYAKWAQVNSQGGHIDPPGGVTQIHMPLDVYTLDDALKEISSENTTWSRYVINLFFDRVVLDEEIELPGTGLVASDPQPIDIAFSNVSTLAYVLLRSSNAIAKLNLTTMQYSKVHWLGAKNYSSQGIDPSSQDGGANLRSFDHLYGLYMPSRMKVIPAYPPFGNKEYIITVNEGEDITQPGGNVTVKDLQLDPVTFPNAAELQSPANLGDLRVVSWKGLKSQLHTELYTGLSRTAETPCDTYSYFQFQVNTSQVCMDMRVQLAAMQGTPDIYVSKDPAVNPEIYDLTWSNYESTSDNIENFVISHLDPEFEPGLYYFGVYAYCEPAQKEAAIYNITVTLEEPASSDSADDLVRFPAVNVVPRVDGGLQYYSFCVVHPCASIQVNLSDCQPSANFCPEVLVSTSVVQPEVEDYTWKTTGGQRSVSISSDDAYNKAGVFYVGVVNRCMDPDPSKCTTPNPESAFNLSVSYPTELPEVCPQKPETILLPPSNAVTLSQNVPVNQSTTCGEYSYFSILIDNPCDDLVVEASPSCPTCGLARIIVSKDYVGSPGYSDRTWTSVETTGKSSVTVSAFDRDFSVEGMFFVGVQADCSAPTGGSTDLKAVSYSLVAQVSSAHVYRWKNVTQVDMMNKMIVDQYVGIPLGYHYYHFCVRNRTSGNVVVTLDNCVSTTNCPETYWWPEMLVSKLRWNPTVSDRAWRLAQLNRNTITLRATDPDVRPGHYFVAVYAWCNKDCNESQVQGAQACAPCQNILRSPYNLTVKQGDAAVELVSPVPQEQLVPQTAIVSITSPLKNSAQRFGFSSTTWRGLLLHEAIAVVIAVFVAALWPLEMA